MVRVILDLAYSGRNQGNVRRERQQQPAAERKKKRCRWQGKTERLGSESNRRLKREVGTSTVISNLHTNMQTIESTSGPGA